MNFYVGLIAWIIIAAVLAGGVVMATHSHPILLLIGLAMFVAGFIRFGCLSH